MQSDGSCICMPGHQFYNPVSQLRVDGDSDGGDIGAGTCGGPAVRGSDRGGIWRRRQPEAPRDGARK